MHVPCVYLYTYFFTVQTSILSIISSVQINTNYKYDNKFLNSSIVFASVSSSQGRVAIPQFDSGWKK